MTAKHVHAPNGGQITTRALGVGMDLAQRSKVGTTHRRARPPSAFLRNVLLAEKPVIGLRGCRVAARHSAAGRNLLQRSTQLLWRTHSARLSPCRASAEGTPEASDEMPLAISDLCVTESHTQTPRPRGRPPSRRGMSRAREPGAAGAVPRLAQQVNFVFLSTIEILCEQANFTLINTE
jgi:hypothetical protein